VTNKQSDRSDDDVKIRQATNFRDAARSRVAKPEHGRYTGIQLYGTHVWSETNSWGKLLEKKERKKEEEGIDDVDLFIWDSEQVQVAGSQRYGTQIVGSQRTQVPESA
jgi:hypothetical protein